MAITSSAKKVIRASAKKRVFNLRRKVSVDQMVKKVQKAVQTGNVEEAVKTLPMAYKAIDKAVKTKFFKKNTGDRMKSRLTVFVNKHSKTKFNCV